MFRPDVTNLQEFYSEPLGMAACRNIRRVIRQILPSEKKNKVRQVIGIGYPLPYLLPYVCEENIRLGAFMPAAQGVTCWPQNDGGNITTLASETELALHDQSVDLVILAHALEFSEPDFFLPELWRVLAPSGKILCILPNRTGWWSKAEKTPFGHGRPYSALQLERTLKEALFTPVSTRHALFMPPFRKRGLIRLGNLYERFGQFIGLPLGGVVVTLAEKRLHAPVNGTKAPAFMAASAHAVVGLRRE